MPNKKPKDQQSNTSDLYNAFLARFKKVCNAMVGEYFWSTIKKEDFKKLFIKRLPPLKLEFSKGDFTPDIEKIWQQNFKAHLQNLHIPVINGKQISMDEYFREGVLLISYLTSLADKNIGNPPIKELLTKYNSPEYFVEGFKKILRFLDMLAIIYSDFKIKALITDCSTTILFAAKNPDNKIKLKFAKTNSTKVSIDHHQRTVFQVGWQNAAGQMKYAFAVPAKLVITHCQDALPVYIQQHALLRMAERLSMQNGLILFTLSLLFNGPLKAIHTSSGHLLSFDYNEKKFGYLVVDLVDHKIIIKTFLFLTNDGTPEGEKLASLTKLRKLDKQFLDIDNLKGISKLAIKDHPELLKIFTEAGCADLLDLEDLTTVLDMDSAQKNPDMLLKYLEGNPYFR